MTHDLNSGYIPPNDKEAVDGDQKSNENRQDDCTAFPVYSSLGGYNLPGVDKALLDKLREEFG